jgi:hypothetical protein
VRDERIDDEARAGGLRGIGRSDSGRHAVKSP